MEQGADGRGRDHRTRQPVVERHHAVFGKSENTARVESGDYSVMHIWRDDAGANIRCEIQRSTQDVNEHHRWKDESLRGCGEVGEVLSAALITFLVLMMRY